MALVLLGHFQAHAQEEKCAAPSADQWSYSDTGVWYLMSKAPANIAGFDDFCDSLGSTMGKVFNQNENDFVANLLVGKHKAWLGGHYLDFEEPDMDNNHDNSNLTAGWYWWSTVEGNWAQQESIVMTYTNWEGGNAPADPEKFSWLVMNGDQNRGLHHGFWMSRPGDEVNDFVCEFRCPEQEPDVKPGDVLYDWSSPDPEGEENCHGCDPIGYVNLTKSYSVRIQANVNFNTSETSSLWFLLGDSSRNHLPQLSFYKSESTSPYPYLRLDLQDYSSTVDRIGEYVKLYSNYIEDFQNPEWTDPDPEAEYATRANITVNVYDHGVEVVYNGISRGYMAYCSTCYVAPYKNCQGQRCSWHGDQLDHYLPREYYEQPVYNGQPAALKYPYQSRLLAVKIVALDGATPPKG